MLKTFTDEHGNTISYQDDLDGEFIIRQSGKEELSFPGEIIKRFIEVWMNSEEYQTREANLWMIDELIARHPDYKDALEKAREGCRDGWMEKSDLNDSARSIDLLNYAFLWEDSPQGYLFWHNWYEDLKNV